MIKVRKHVCGSGADRRRARMKWALAALTLVLLLAAAACAQRGPAPNPEPETPPVGQSEAPAQQTPQDTKPAADAEPTDPLGDEAPQFLAAGAEYPVMLQYPGSDDWEAVEKWYNQRQTRREQYPAKSEMISGFLTASLPRLLDGARGENRVCSPLNIYMALAMAAEISDGESRVQLLKLLDAESVETLEENAELLWNACYCDDGTAVSILAGSLWMRDDTPCLKGTVKTLRDVFHASSYRGDMSDPRYTKALRDWLNEQTGGQLAGAVDSVGLEPETVLELVTTIYFRAKWLSQFDPEQTFPQTFHSPGGDVECDFMHEDWADFSMYRGARFIAVQQSFENAGDMWFILPDKGVTPEELLNDPETIAFMSTGTEDTEWCYGELALPKLDVTSDTELSDALKALGVTDIFDPERADISPLYEDMDGAALTKVQHAARLTMDEEGVTATAFTAMGYGAGGPENQMDFTLDRPFLFVVKTESGLPLFAGIVNEP